MQHVFPSKTTDANEVSVSNHINEQLPTSDSRSNAEPSSPQVSRPRAEKNRQLPSCIGTGQSTELASSLSAEHQNSREPSPEAHIRSRLSMDSIPETNRPSRQEVDSPRSIYTGERLDGVQYSERSLSFEASSIRASRRKTSKRDSHRRHSDFRDTQHRSRDYNQSRSERKGRSRHFDSHDDRRRGHRHDDSGDIDDNPHGNRDNYSRDDNKRKKVHMLTTTTIAIPGEMETTIRFLITTEIILVKQKTILIRTGRYTASALDPYSGGEDSNTQHKVKAAVD